MQQEAQFVRQSIRAARAVLLSAFNAGVSAAHPKQCMARALPPLPAQKKTNVLAVGKAAASMTEAVFAYYEQSFPGIVLSRYGHLSPEFGDEDAVSSYEAGHPVPDAASEAAAEAVFRQVSELTASDHLLALFSGGGSSLLTRPAGSIALADKQHVTRQLLGSGASISEINCVRKHLSSVKGGRLALAAAPALVTTLVISDVPGDDPSLIASGPTLPDNTSLEDARQILLAYDVEVPRAVVEWLSVPGNETPKPGAACFRGHRVEVMAKGRDAVDAATSDLRSHGYRVLNLGYDIEGDAALMGRDHARLVRDVLGSGGPTALISGGELTVSLSGGKPGRGGPNTEYILSLALELGGVRGVAALACDTDGIDGSGDNAGAIFDQTTQTRAEIAGIEMREALSRHDSYGVFQALGDLVITGPTLTNVNDLRIILINP